MKSIDAVILAREGSKRVPGKNIKIFCGKPLIAWTIEEALKSPSIRRVIVSTDSKEIASISTLYGAEVPFIRPKSLATSHTSSIDSIIHAIKKLRLDGDILLLQPTSPLRKVEDIEGIIDLYRHGKSFSSVSVVRAQDDRNPLFSINNFRLIDQREFDQTKLEEGNYYMLNGALYISSAKHICKNKSFITESTTGYLMPFNRSVDIDTNEDWGIAESLMELRVARE